MSMKLRMLQALAMGALLSETNYDNGRTDEKQIDFTPKVPPIPKGCKEYFFNSEGEFSTERMRKDEMVFKCIASNDKSAKRKFNNWLNSVKNHDRDK